MGRRLLGGRVSASHLEGWMFDPTGSGALPESYFKYDFSNVFLVSEIN